MALLATRSVLLPSKPGFAPGPTTAGNRTCARAAGKAEGRSLAARVGAPPDHYGATVQVRSGLSGTRPLPRAESQAAPTLGEVRTWLVRRCGTFDLR